MFDYKLQKIKKYLKENLRKSFISSSTIFFASFVLFVIKLNKELRFCVNYRRLNALTRKNRYSISLIKKTLTKVTKCKYFIKLDIIAAFNKLRMHSNSEDYIIFVISLRFYKYYVLSFNLTNELFNYQHYMNDILFDYIN